jgi:uncharacterized glyoxalase superfamily protein PhnB
MSLDAIGIVCEDVKSSIEFYELLGLEFKASGKGHHEAVLPSGIRLMLDTVTLIKRINPDWKKPIGSSVILCFKQDSVEAVDSCYKVMVAAGAASQKEPWDAFWGQRYACVFDPDGHQIDIFADA